jgi:hypothetical protein
MEQGYTQGLNGLLGLLRSLLPTIREPGCFTGRLDLFWLRSRIKQGIVLDPIAIVALTEATKAAPYRMAIINYTDVHLGVEEYGFIKLLGTLTARSLPPFHFKFFFGKIPLRMKLSPCPLWAGA